MADIPSVNEDLLENFRTNCVGFAGFTVLIWDHIDTFSTEVEYIWKGSKGPLVYLFFLNRYLTPLGFIVNLYAYLNTAWSRETCEHFIRYEGAMTIIGIHVVALMMLLRVRALYAGNRMVIGFVAILFLVMLSVNAWLMTHGVAVVHNPNSGVRACTMIFTPDISDIASSSAWLPLLYDSSVLLLTLFRTLPAIFLWQERHLSLIRRQTSTGLRRRLLEDGLLYFTAIFAVNLVLMLMIVYAPPGLKNIAAQLELLITVTMMSRITLNLRKTAAARGTTTQRMSHLVVDHSGTRSAPTVFRVGSTWPDDPDVDDHGDRLRCAPWERAPSAADHV